MMEQSEKKKQEFLEGIKNVYEGGLKQGRKEVAEWVETALLVHPDNRQNWIACTWKGKCKEWGL